MNDLRNSKKQKWWHDAVTYQVYVPSFCDSNGDGVGDIKGITSKLDYLKNLGAECIWLTPIMESPFADCGYDVSNYLTINPMLGTMEDFEELLNETHKRGMKLILDVVFGHTSDKHKWFLDACEKGEESETYDYYIWHEPVNGGVPNNWYQGCMCGPQWTYVESVGKYYYHSFVKDQPHLNWSNTKVKEEMYKTFEFWLDKGVDGYRLDAINFLMCDLDFRNNPGEGRKQRRLVNLNQLGVHDIIKGFRKIADKFEDIMLVGEVYPGTTDEGRLFYGNSENELTQAFNFTFLHTLKEYSSYKDEWGNLQQTGHFDKDSTHVTKKIMDLWKYNEFIFKPLEIWPTVVLGNHDQPRIASILEGLTTNKDYAELAVKIAPFYTFTLKGSPFIYYGEELGMHSIMPKSIETVKDKHGLYFYEHQTKVLGIDSQTALEKTNNVARDHCRQAMAWNSSENAGFSTNSNIWATLPPNWKVKNIEKSLENSDSLYYLYQRLMKLRKENSALTSGDYIWPEEQELECLLFGRKSSDKYLIIAMNLSEKTCEINLKKSKLVGDKLKIKSIVLESSGLARLEKETIILPPFTCIIIE